ncbi:MAG: 4Fe-4S binding protein [Planctomycetes bacterium]|nr:4Fe-4S binding protein [Planctomycetota bacterium]
MPEWLKPILESLENHIETASANIKLLDQALSGMEGSYVELLTILALGLLAVIPVLVPSRRRQALRHLNQIFGIAIFIFVVYTCLGVFGMIRNFHRGLNEIGRENIVALYYCSVPVTVLVMSMIFGPTFCGWICPTGALQEFAGMIFGRWHRCRKAEGYPFSWKMLAMTILIALVFLGWMGYLSVTRVFFIEDASIYWSEVLILLLLLLVWKMGTWDKRLRKLRVLSFFIIVAAAIASLRITSPVHFGFSKVYDPASLLATVMVVLAALTVPHIWCRYLCPWREAIAWAAKHSVRSLKTDHEKCNQCGVCDMVCGVDAIQKGVIDPHECHMCLKCVDACPQKAIAVKDKWKAES